MTAQSDQQGSSLIVSPAGQATLMALGLIVLAAIAFWFLV
jgi:hypothetical protein